MTEDTSRPVEQPRPTVEVDGVPLSEGFPIRKVHLEILNGKDTGRRVTSERPNLRLGADPMCDFILQDPTVSRNHAEVRLRGQTFMLVDLNSTNGTYLDDIRIDTVALRPGTIFRVGRTEVRFDVTTEKVSISPTEQTQYDNIIGKSQALREIFSILDRVAPSELSMVIEGETGTGKELIARAIHEHSNRSTGPFVVFDCSAFPPSLLESELFGHEKGAFTGAVNRHRGVFERAHGGTLFFDELGELEAEFQAKFLRVLETGQVRRVGAEKTMQVDVRMVSATNRNLEEMVARKEFRSDLFYRLAQVRFLLPPLRQRREDILLLVEHFLEQQVERTGRRPFLEPEAVQVLQSYDWPGNIRELRNSIEKAVALSRDGTITADYFRQEIKKRSAAHAAAAASAAVTTSYATAPIELDPTVTPLSIPRSVLVEMRDPTVAKVSSPMIDGEGDIMPFKEIKEDIISAFEVQYLELLLERTGMNISKASRQAGIDRRHFYRLLKKHDINTDD